MRCENLRRIVLGGEKNEPGVATEVRDLALEIGATNLDVVATYGFTEAKLAWPECPFPHDQPSSGYHLYPDLGITEVINPQTGETVAPAKRASWCLPRSRRAGAWYCAIGREITLMVA